MTPGLLHIWQSDPFHMLVTVSIIVRINSLPPTFGAKQCPRSTYFLAETNPMMHLIPKIHLDEFCLHLTNFVSKKLNSSQSKSHKNAPVWIAEKRALL